jgi:hypothetical protein
VLQDDAGQLIPQEEDPHKHAEAHGGGGGGHKPAGGPGASSANINNDASKGAAAVKRMESFIGEISTDAVRRRSVVDASVNASRTPSSANININTARRPSSIVIEQKQLSSTNVASARSATSGGGAEAESHVTVAMSVRPLRLMPRPHRPAPPHPPCLFVHVLAQGNTNLGSRSSLRAFSSTNLRPATPASVATARAAATSNARPRMI